MAAPLPTLHELGIASPPLVPPPAGEAAAQAQLTSFLDGRALGYRQHLSSPLQAETGCSRLSEHLAYGTVSLRSVHQATEQAIRHTESRELAYALRGFAGRLRWHCHLMQKLEGEPAIECRNFARSVDGLRQTRQARDEARAIQNRHGSRKSGLPSSDGPAQAGARKGHRPTQAEPGDDRQGRLLCSGQVRGRASPRAAGPTKKPGLSHERPGLCW